MRRSGAWAALLLAGCAARGAPPPVTPEGSGLAAEFDRAFAAPEFARAQWGVVVQSLDNGQVLYERHAHQLIMPASNQKILTGAVALARLGPDFRYRTTVLARGARRGDTLTGDLVVIGRGDPTLSQHATGGADILASLRPWADSLRARGIRRVAGRIVADGSYFPGPVLGEGWTWDDLQDSYAAPVGAAQFNEGFAVVTVTPGVNAGDPATVTLRPADAPLRVAANVVTAPRDSNLNQVRWTRVFFTDSVVVSGRLSAGRDSLEIEVAVRDPARYFELALGQALREAGITTGNGEWAMGNGTAIDTLFTWHSRPLREILPLLEKPSQNQIAETLLYTLGAELRGAGTRDSGRAVVRETLTSWGIADDAYVFVDGSGLSRYNYVAPEALAAVLMAVGRGPHFALFRDALPIAGVDGTIRTRMRRTAAAENVHAKTGSIANVRSLSGYVTTADGERLVFVLIANHFTVSRRVIERTQDHLAERLANFRRHPAGR